LSSISENFKYSLTLIKKALALQTSNCATGWKHIHIQNYMLKSMRSNEDGSKDDISGFHSNENAD
jgi:hypothetical protein